MEVLPLSRNVIEPLLTDPILMQLSFLQPYDQQKNRKANVNRYGIKNQYQVS